MEITKEEIIEQIKKVESMKLVYKTHFGKMLYTFGYGFIPQFSCKTPLTSFRMECTDDIKMVTCTKCLNKLLKKAEYLERKKVQA